MLLHNFDSVVASNVSGTHCEIIASIDIVTCMRFPWLNNVSDVVTMA
jgi:hypothetical protein